MATKLSSALAAVSFAALLTVTSAKLNAQQSTDSQIRIGGSDLGGVVTSAKGPEAGVWVIAETADLPTKFAKIVVTDDQGRYVIPGLPNASYSVWVRGYGLVNSPKLQARPGAIVNLTAVEAPTPAAAADYYPALYWYALLKIPGKSEFSGSGRNGIPPALKTQEQWLDIVKTDGCFTCHQIGDKATRTIPKELGHFKSRWRHGNGAFSQARRAAPWSMRLGGSTRIAPWRCLPIGRTGLPPANCRRRRRRGRKASSGMSSCRYGIGPPPRPTCMTRFPRTSEILPSTQMA